MNGELTPRDPEKPWMRVTFPHDVTTGSRMSRVSTVGRRIMLDTKHLIAYWIGDILVVYIHDDLRE